MSQWVRLWEDMPDDPKWRVVAKRSGRPLSEVVAVFTRMLVNASRSSNRGTLETWNDEDEAIALHMDEANVAGIREAMQGKVLEGLRLTGWEKRQPKREDSSSERVRAFREREAELKRGETHGNARPDDETHRNAPDKSRVDKKREEKKETRARRASSDAFLRFWNAWPHKVGRPAAERAFNKHEDEIEDILVGVAAYVHDKPADRSWLNPATFLNQERWKDAPAPVSIPKRQPNDQSKSVVDAARRLHEELLRDELRIEPSPLRLLP